MKRISLFFAALCVGICMNAQSTSETTSFYLIPDGSFYLGMTSTAGIGKAYIYMPATIDSSHVFRSLTGPGEWVVGGNIKATDSETYTRKLAINYSSTNNMPALTCAGKNTYEYGTKSSERKMYCAYGSYALMTNARLWADTTALSTSQSQTKWSTWRTTVANVDTFGTFFYNYNPMVIKGISIPITGVSNSATVDDFFPNEDSKITVNIYSTTATPKGDGTYTRSYSRKNKLVETITLTKADFSVNSSYSYRGALNCTFSNAILSTKPFFIEVTGFKSCGDFYFYADNYCKCYASYYVRGGKNYVPTKGNLLFSVNAYFPAAEPDVHSFDVPAEASELPIKFLTNAKYSASSWDITKPDWVESFTVDTTGGNAYTPTFNFAVKENTITEARFDTIWFNFKGYKSFAVVNQAAATPAGPKTLAEVIDQKSVLRVTNDATGVYVLAVSPESAYALVKADFDGNVTKEYVTSFCTHVATDAPGMRDLADIALTADGVLLGINSEHNTTTKTTGQATLLYKWNNDGTGEIFQDFDQVIGSNNNPVAGNFANATTDMLAFNGTLNDGVLAVRAMTQGSGNRSRIGLFRFENGAITAKNAAKDLTSWTATSGIYLTNALTAGNFVWSAANVATVEFASATALSVTEPEAIAATATMDAAYNGISGYSFATIGAYKIMFVPTATGVQVYNVTAGLDQAASMETLNATNVVENPQYLYAGYNGTSVVLVRDGVVETIAYAAPTTGIEEMSSANNIRKIIINGNLYIVRDNVMYNMQGQIVE